MAWFSQSLSFTPHGIDLRFRSLANVWHKLVFAPSLRNPPRWTNLPFTLGQHHPPWQQHHRHTESTEKGENLFVFRALRGYHPGLMLSHLHWLRVYTWGNWEGEGGGKVDTALYCFFRISSGLWLISSAAGFHPRATSWLPEMVDLFGKLLVVGTSVGEKD